MVIVPHRAAKRSLATKEVARVALEVEQLMANYSQQEAPQGQPQGYAHN